MEWFIVYPGPAHPLVPASQDGADHSFPLVSRIDRPGNNDREFPFLSGSYGRPGIMKRSICRMGR